MHNDGVVHKNNLGQKDQGNNTWVFDSDVIDRSFCLATEREKKGV